MLTPQFGLPLHHELVIDLFAGGGGASTGIEQAIGRPVDIAVNHDRKAVAQHFANHPQTRHYVEDVFRVDPREVTEGQPVGLLWASPDCTYHSKARGGKPHRDRNKARRRRGLAGVVVKWARAVKPRVIILENVEEWRWWGPLLDDGQPCPRRRGQSFERWATAMRNSGYTMEYRELRASTLNTPTIRNRLYVICTRAGSPVWPAATNGPSLKPFKTAAECIDWSLEGQSIFARKKDLAENTLRRLAKGLWKHSLTSASPYIVNTRNGERSGQEPRTRGVDEPYWTPTASGSQGAVAKPVFVAAPHIVGLAHSGTDDRSHGPKEPLRTIHAGGGNQALSEPVFLPFVSDQSRPLNSQSAPADAPLRTQCANVKGGHFNLVTAAMVPLRGTSPSHLGASQRPDEPTGTISAGGTHHALLTAHLLHFTHHGDRPGTSPADGLPTVTGANRGEQAVAVAHFEQANGGFYDGQGRAAGDPMSTITTAGSNQQLVTAYFVKYYSNGGQWQGAGDPMHTLPTKGRMGLVEVIHVAADSLAPEHRARAKQCADLMHKYLPEHFPEVADMVLTTIKGVLHVLADLTLRMLQPRELYNAQGFPSDYIIEWGIDPFTMERVTMTKTDQVRMCGNSVCPPVAAALVRANYRELQPMAEAA